MGLLDLLFGSSGDDATAGNGFLAPLFGPSNSPPPRDLPRAVSRFPLHPWTVSPLPVQSPQPVQTRTPNSYWARISEENGFAKGPASNAALESELPGIEDGPADAFGHMVWAAELTRRYGAAIASDILDEHEKFGRHQAGWTQDAENMDRRNNTVGIRIGQTAKDYGDVLRQVEVMIKSAAPDGSGGWRDPNNHAPIPAPIWFPRDQWKGASGPEMNWYDNPAHPGKLVFPEVWPHAKAYPFGGAEETYAGSVPSAIEGWLGAREQQYVEPSRHWWYRNMPPL